MAISFKTEDILKDRMMLELAAKFKDEFVDDFTGLSKLSDQYQEWTFSFSGRIISRNNQYQISSVKVIVDLHGKKVKVENNYGKSIKFDLEDPLALDYKIIYEMLYNELLAAAGYVYSRDNAAYINQYDGATVRIGKRKMTVALPPITTAIWNGE